MTLPDCDDMDIKADLLNFASATSIALSSQEKKKTELIFVKYEIDIISNQ